jgi:hypothetical protein
VGPLQLQAAPPSSLVLSEVLASNGTGCGGGLSGSGSSSGGSSADRPPCLHVSALSPSSPLNLQLTGAHLGTASASLSATLTGYTVTTTVSSSVAATTAAASLGAAASATSVSTTTITPIVLPCTPLRLYAASLLTCSITSPLPRGNLTLTLLNLASRTGALALPALGACAVNTFTDFDGEYCRPCPPGAQCIGGLDTARALPGFYRASGAPVSSGGGGGAATAAAAMFLPCPVPTLCAGNGACAGGTSGLTCSTCPSGSVMVTGSLCVNCASSTAASLSSFVGACVGAGAAVALVVWGSLWSRKFTRSDGSSSSSSSSSSASDAGRGKDGQGMSGSGHSPLPLLPLFTILASPIHALVVLASFYTPILQAQGIAGAVAPSSATALASGSGSDALVATLAALKAVRDLGTSTAAAACLFSPTPWQRALAVTLLPLLLALGIYLTAAGCFLARFYAARRQGGRLPLSSKGPSALLPLPEDSSSASASASAPPTATVNPAAAAVLGLPSTVGALVQNFRARLAALEGEVAARESRILALQGHLSAVHVQAQAAVAAAAQAEPDTAHSAWLLSPARASGAYVTALLLLLLLPQTLLFSFAWLQCAPVEAGNYVLEEPGLSCSDAGYVAWIVPLQLVPLYLLLPLLAILYQLCSAAGAGAGAGASYPTSTLAALGSGYHATLPLARIWECATLLRKAAFAAMATGWLGVSQPLSRVTGCAGIALCALAAHLLVRPYAAASVNALEGLGLTCTLVWTLALLPRVQSGTSRLVGLDAVGYALALVVLLAWCLLVVDTVCARGVGNAWLEVELGEWAGRASASASSTSTGAKAGTSASEGGEEGQLALAPSKGGGSPGDVGTANPLLALPEKGMANPLLAATATVVPAAAAGAAASSAGSPAAPPPASSSQPSPQAPPAAASPGGLAIRALPTAREVWTPPPFAGLGSPLLVLGRGPSSNSRSEGSSRVLSASTAAATAAPSPSPLGAGAGGGSGSGSGEGSAGAASPRQAAMASLYASSNVLRLAKTFGGQSPAPAAQSPAAASPEVPSLKALAGSPRRSPGLAALSVGEGAGGAAGGAGGAAAGAAALRLPGSPGGRPLAAGAGGERLEVLDAPSSQDAWE